jgi:hypothetical protein
MKCSFRLTALTIVCWSLISCRELPGDFAALPLDKKIEAYARRGGRSFYAENLIAAHGYAAAEAMVPYITEEKHGILKINAIDIVWDVQSRGCDLRGSKAEKVLRQLIRDEGVRRDLRTAAEGTLESIEMGRHAQASSKPLPPGVCRPTSVPPAEASRVNQIKN